MMSFENGSAFFTGRILPGFSSRYYVNYAITMRFSKSLDIATWGIWRKRGIEQSIVQDGRLFSGTTGRRLFWPRQRHKQPQAVLAPVRINVRCRTMEQANSARHSVSLYTQIRFNGKGHLNALFYHILGTLYRGYKVPRSDFLSSPTNTK